MIYISYTKSIALSVLLLSLTIKVCSQQRPDTTKTYSIGEVTVVGSKINRELIPVQSLSGEQLKRLSAHSVADAVRYFSGTQIKDYGGVGGLKTVNIRSMGTNHVGVFYDGIELGNAQNGVVDLGRFSLDNMDAVSLYNGQKSAIFQPAKDFASASSIYLSTRTPMFQDGKRYNLNIAMKTGSFGTANPSILWEQSINDNLSSSVSAEYLYTTGHYKFRTARQGGYDTTEVRRNGDVSSLRVEAGLYGKIKNGSWRAKAYLFNSERGYPGAAVREQPGKFLHQDRQWDNSIFAQGSMNKSFKPWYSLQLNAKYAYDYLHYLSDPRLDVSTMHVDNRYLQQEIYLSAANLFTMFDWWSASLSTDFQWNTLDADLYNFVYPSRSMALTAAATSLTFERFKFQASLLHTFVSDKTKTAGANAKDRSEFTPTVVASYQPFAASEFNIRAFYKRIFRMPTLNDLYYTFVGNIALDPEYTNQYNVGLTYGKNFDAVWLKRFEIQTDVYYNQVENKIVAMPSSNHFRWTMVNLGNVEIRGIDVALQGQWKIGKVGVDTRLNYTYQKAQDFTDPEDTYYGGQIPYIPWHSGTAIIGLDYRDWSLNYSFIYTGERYESSANIPVNYVQPWYTHDMSVSKLIKIKSKELRITAELNNIFNQPYEVVQSYPMPGTNFKIKINIML